MISAALQATQNDGNDRRTRLGAQQTAQLRPGDARHGKVRNYRIRCFLESLNGALCTILAVDHGEALQAQALGEHRAAYIGRVDQEYTRRSSHLPLNGLYLADYRAAPRRRNQRAFLRLILVGEDLLRQNVRDGFVPNVGHVGVTGVARPSLPRSDTGNFAHADCDPILPLAGTRLDDTPDFRICRSPRERARMKWRQLRDDSVLKSLVMRSGVGASTLSGFTSLNARRARSPSARGPRAAQLGSWQVRCSPRRFGWVARASVQARPVMLGLLFWSPHVA